MPLQGGEKMRAVWAQRQEEASGFALLNRLSSYATLYEENWHTSQPTALLRLIHAATEEDSAACVTPSSISTPSSAFCSRRATRSSLGPARRHRATPRHRWKRHSGPRATPCVRPKRARAQSRGNTPEAVRNAIDAYERLVQALRQVQEHASLQMLPRPAEGRHDV